VIPQSAHEDERNTAIMAQLMEHVNSGLGERALDVISVPGSSIDASVSLPIILPCVAASRVGSDISAALGKARIGT
jgi:hypothetical protein